MEFLNKIEIRGIVGNVTIHKTGTAAVARCSVVTEYAYKDRSGCQCIDCTWFQVCIWERPYAPNSIEQIKKGATIHVEGRVRVNRYTDGHGVERPAWEVLGTKWDIEG